MTYDETITTIKRAYESRLLRKLESVKAACMSEGLTVEGPYEMHDEEYVWAIAIAPPEGKIEQTAEVKLTITEQKVHDGDGTGVSFAVDITGWGGEIIGDLAPYNYTADVWVPSERAAKVEERFEIIERADIGEAVTLIVNWIDSKTGASV